MDLPSTPLAVISTVSRLVTQIIDRRLGDRVDYPLMVAAVCVEALHFFKIRSQIMYGAEAWIEIMEDDSVRWAGCWGDFFHFWVVTEFQETVELNLSVAHRKRVGHVPLKALYSPPLLWSQEIPRFCCFVPQGVAQLELVPGSREDVNYQGVLSEVLKHCSDVQKKRDPNRQALDSFDFPQEAILCPGRRLLDDARQSFRYFDRALAVHGLPPLPPFFEKNERASSGSA